jgi:DNA-binding response OmpR family regulator
MSHILVIDDEADIRFILETFFRKAGHTIDTAGDGKAGMHLVELNHYDLVITDIVMPEMDGLEVIASMKRKYPNIRIIVMTGGTNNIDKELLLTTANLMRADKVVAKPLDLKVLKAAVTEVLAG